MTGEILNLGGISWMLPQLLHADDAIVLSASEEDLDRIANQYDDVCRRRRRKVNVRVGFLF